MATVKTGTGWSAFAPFSKIDVENRTVGGWATVEEPDRQRKTVDYESAKVAIGGWAGNMREMHGLSAVGKAVSVEPDDAGKRIWLESYVSKSADGENTWTKIQEGILTGYSIAGELSKRVPEVVKDAAGKVLSDAREFVKSITEISYVDLPAAPSAVFALTKGADFLADLPADEPAPEPILAVADGQSLSGDTYIGPDGQPMTGELTPDQVAAAKAAMPNLAPVQEIPVATETTDTVTAVAPVTADAEPAPATAKAAEPVVAKAALDDMADAHMAAFQIGLMIDSAGEGVDVGTLKSALAAVEAWGATQAAAIGTPADDAAKEADAADEPIPVVIVADYSYAAVAGDLAKLAIARKDDPDAPVPVYVQQILELAKAAGATLPGEPVAITKAAIGAAVDEAVGSDETIAKFSAGLVDRMGPMFAAVKSELLEEFQRGLAPMSEQIEKIASRPVREGPFRYAPGRGGELLQKGEEALGVPIAEALAKAAGMTNDPALKEELGRLSAAAEIRGQMG